MGITGVVLTAKPATHLTAMVRCSLALARRIFSYLHKIQREFLALTLAHPSNHQFIHKQISFSLCLYEETFKMYTQFCSDSWTTSEYTTQTNNTATTLWSVRLFTTLKRLACDVSTKIMMYQSLD